MRSSQPRSNLGGPGCRWKLGWLFQTCVTTMAFDPYICSCWAVHSKYMPLPYVFTIHFHNSFSPSIFAYRAMLLHGCCTLLSPCFVACQVTMSHSHSMSWWANNGRHQCRVARRWQSSRASVRASQPYSVMCNAAASSGALLGSTVV